MKFYIAGMGVALVIALASALFLPGIASYVPFQLVTSDESVWLIQKKADIGNGWLVEITIDADTVKEDCQRTLYSHDRNFRITGPCAQVEIIVNKQVATRAAPLFSA